MIGMLQRLCSLVLKAGASRAFLWVTGLWFVAQTSFFALTTRMGLPPDETFHLTFIKMFSENKFSPFLGNQEGYYALGEVVRTPFFLYHYLLSFPYALTHNYIFLRFINVGLAVGSFLLVCAIARELKVTNLVRNLSLFILTNTLMFVFLAGAVSYDNLFIFLSLASILLLLRLFRGVTAFRVLLLAVCIAAGLLVKINFLPVAVAVVVVLAVRHYRRYQRVWQDIRKTFSDRRHANRVLVVIFGLLSILILHRYGYNLVRYHTYAPSCPQVQSLEQCRQNALFVRNEILFGNGHPKPDKDPFEYVYDWIPLIQLRTYGIFAHEAFDPNWPIRIWTQILVAAGVAATIRAWRKKDRLFTLLIGISLFYVLTVILENYRIYLGSGRFSFVMHGRYLFAVVPVLYIISTHYLLKLLTNRYARTGLVGITIIVFALSSLPTYVLNADRTWLNPTADRALQRLINR